MIPKVIRLMGVDPGLAELGLAYLEHDVEANETHLIEAVAVTTRPMDRKIRRTDEDLRRRLSEIVDVVALFVEERKPALAAFESAPMVRNASVSQKIGLAWGAVFAIVHHRGIAVEVYSPQEIKLGCGLKKSASKADVAAVVQGRWPEFDKWPRVKSRIEHPVDAIGAVITAMRGEQFRAIRSALGGRNA